MNKKYKLTPKPLFASRPLLTQEESNKAWGEIYEASITERDAAQAKIAAQQELITKLNQAISEKDKELAELENEARLLSILLDKATKRLGVPFHHLDS